MAGGANVLDDDDDGEISDINVTPLVDVTLVLLIIMMVAAPMLAASQAIKVELPKATTGEDAPKSVVALQLRKDGLLYYNAEQVTEAEAERRVKVEHDKDAQVQAVIDADKGVYYGRVITVLDLVKRQGVTAFALNIDASP